MLAAATQEPNCDHPPFTRSVQRTRARRAARLAFVFVLFCAPAAAQPDSPSGKDEVVATTISAVAVHGRLRAFSLKDGLKLESSADAEVATVPAGEVVQIIVHQGSPSAAPSERRSPVEVLLAGDDRLFGRPVPPPDDRAHAPDEEIVLFETAVLGVVEVPLSWIERWANTATHRSAFAAPDRSRAPALSRDDRLLLANGDVVYGILLTIDDHQLTFESDRTEMSVPLPQVAAVDLVSEAPARAAGLRAHVTFTDGSRVTTDELVYADGELELTVFDGRRRTVGLDRVTRIDVAGGRWVWITELQPISVQHTPMLSLRWPYVENANVLGDPMRIAGRAFAHGLGVHSESSLTYDLAGGYGQFVTFFGIDDSAGVTPALADVTAEVCVDGQVRHRQSRVRSGKLWGPIRIDVGGAARIELHARFGENASVQDRFNWADAGLIRTARSAE